MSTSERVDSTVLELAAWLVPGSNPPYPLRTGLQSRTYGIDGGSQSYVLRIAGRRAGFDKDAYAATAFGHSDLPVPEVVAVGETGADAYCLSRRLPGTPVNQDTAGAESEVVDALERTLHRVWRQDVSHTTGFGSFDHTGNGGFASWLGHLVDSSPARAAVERGAVSTSVAERLHGYIIDRARDCPDRRVLLHGDFGSANVLTDGHAVTGVLDWELAGYGDPLYDVAEILQWEGGEPCMSALARQLRRNLPGDSHTRRRIECYRARICLGELAWGAEATLDWMGRIAESIAGRTR